MTQSIQDKLQSMQVFKEQSTSTQKFQQQLRDRKKRKQYSRAHWNLLTDHVNTLSLLDSKLQEREQQLQQDVHNLQEAHSKGKELLQNTNAVIQRLVQKRQQVAEISNHMKRVHEYHRTQKIIDTLQLLSRQFSLSLSNVERKREQLIKHNESYNMRQNNEVQPQEEMSLHLLKEDETNSLHSISALLLLKQEQLQHLKSTEAQEYITTLEKQMQFLMDTTKHL